MGAPAMSASEYGHKVAQSPLLGWLPPEELNTEMTLAVRAALFNKGHLISFALTPWTLLVEIYQELYADLVFYTLQVDSLKGFAQGIASCYTPARAFKEYYGFTEPDHKTFDQLKAFEIACYVLKGLYHLEAFDQIPLPHHISDNAHQAVAMLFQAIYEDYTPQQVMASDILPKLCQLGRL